MDRTVYYVVPVRAEFDLIERFIQSLYAQTNDSWIAHIVDDNSPLSDVDRKKLHLLVDNEPRIFLHENSERQGPLHNVYNIIVNELDGDDTIIAQADGDDWLLPFATSTILTYHKSNIDVTYGQFVRHAPDTLHHGAEGHCGEYPIGARLEGSYEDYPWLASHLKTFKRKYFMKIPYEMFIDPRNGNFWNSSYDMAYMLPILKLAPMEKIAFNPIPIYMYNMVGWGEPTGGHVNPHVQEETAKYIIEAIKMYMNEKVRWHEDPVSGSSQG
jgi:glycosyltransferase involved in cell wall biosynthesis